MKYLLVIVAFAALAIGVRGSNGKSSSSWFATVARLKSTWEISEE